MGTINILKYGFSTCSLFITLHCKKTIGCVGSQLKLPNLHFPFLIVYALPEEISWFFSYKLYLSRLFHRTISMKSFEHEKKHTSSLLLQNNDILYLSLLYFIHNNTVYSLLPPRTVIYALAYVVRIQIVG